MFEGPASQPLGLLSHCSTGAEEVPAGAALRLAATSRGDVHPHTLRIEHKAVNA